MSCSSCLRLSLPWAAASVLVLAACPGKIVDPIALTDTSTLDTTGDDDPIGDGDPGDGDGDPQPGNSHAVDVLIVLDDSGSMGAAQAKLASAIDTLVDALDAGGADYRVAVTTSNNGNPWCPSGSTTPEGGKFVMSSCKDRLGDFLFNNGEVDVQDIACNDLCPLTSSDLEIQPTTTHVDNTAAQRPWIESIGGQTNLPQGTDVAEALRCVLPMGVNGCGFESQLESMYLGLLRTESEGEENYGFLRPGAVLAILLVSDEADCSYNKSYATIFEQDGNRVFWSDPNAMYPTSAVCWNAGVSCTGDPSNYSSCVSTNKDVNGGQGVSDSDAVLYPMSRYHGLLMGIEQSIQDLEPGREVVVGLIGGVGSDGSVVYADVTATDPGFQDGFGVGPGCSAPNPLDPNAPIQAVPPVRMYELVGELSSGNAHSICAPDFSSGLAAFAARITDQLP